MAVTLSSDTGTQKLKIVQYVSAALPQTTTSDIFTVSGVVQVTNIIGFTTTAIQAQANNMKLGFDVGGGSQNISADLDINGDAQFTMYNLTGTVTDPANEVATGIHNAMEAPFVFFSGDITMTCSASSTGAIDWYVTYIPLSPGAEIALA